MQKSNLKKLQKWMTENNVSAFFVPHGDMFHGEYVAPHDDKLAWVSGFDGSAGCAIITTDDAFLFVDGRYKLQAAIQSKEFKIRNYSQADLNKFINEELKSKEISYDPWLVSFEELNNFKKQIKMVALKNNPVDLFWNSRVIPTPKQAYDFELKYAGQTREEKLRIFREKMKKNNEQAWFIGDSEIVCWLMNLRGEDLNNSPILQSMAFITTDSVNIFCNKSKITNELQKLAIFKAYDINELADFINNQKVSICADTKYTPSAIINENTQFVWKENPCYLMRAQKNIIQQNGMRNAHIRDAVAVLKFWKWLEQQNGITEIQAQEFLYKCRAEQDLFKCESFSTISAFGGHGAIVHYRSTQETNTTLDNGLYLCDSGGHYLDGTTDITRVYAIGTAPTQKQKQHYTLVLKGHIALAKIHFPKGTFGSQLDALARQYLWQEGLDYGHGTGHGVGNFLNVHEWPGGAYNKGNNIKFELGMVVSNEPGVYIENEYGIRIENLQMVTQSNINQDFYMFETLTFVPYDINLIDINLLSRSEINWIKAYYQKIKSTLTPLLEEPEINWLSTKLVI